jgi:hypothetical protein
MIIQRTLDDRRQMTPDKPKGFKVAFEPCLGTSRAGGHRTLESRQLDRVRTRKLNTDLAYCTTVSGWRQSPCLHELHGYLQTISSTSARQNPGKKRL